MLIGLVLLFFLFTVVLTSNKNTDRRGPTIHFCNGGMEGHHRRVAEFYGDDYDEELQARKDLQAKVDSGEIVMRSGTLKDFMERK